MTDTSSPFLHWTERHLQALWFEQRHLIVPLHLADGRTLRVIDPGIWNHRSGPDFLSAHLLVGNEEWRGDIEIHFDEKDWFAHAHQNNRDYLGVVLHVCAVKSVSSKPLVIPILYLADSLTLPAEQILPLLDLDHYPYQQLTIPGRCAQQTFAHLSQDKAVFLFLGKALKRLEEKLRYLKGWAPDITQVPIFGIAGALGYRNNSLPFMRIALEVLTRRDELQGIEQVLTYMFGRAGFFAPKFQTKWASSSVYMGYLARWLASPHHSQPPYRLQLDHIRPPNYPLRRLFLLAQYITRPDYHQKILKLPDEIDQSWQAFNGVRPKTFLQRWKYLLPLGDDPYWHHHYTFLGEPSKYPMSLLGDDLAQEIVVNLFLPLLYERILQRSSDDNMEELVRFQHFYLQLPANPSTKSKYLSWRFFQRTEDSSLQNSRACEQGAFQLHREFCIHFEASCSGCNFPEAFSQQQRNH